MEKKGQFILIHLKTIIKILLMVLLMEKNPNDINNQLDEVNEGIEVYEKNKESYKNSSNIKDQVNNSKKFAEGLEKNIDIIKNDKLRKIDSSNGSNSSTGSDFIDLSWINDLENYKEISKDIIDRYNKDQYSNELLSLNSFIDNINDGYIKDKKDARKESRTVKEKIKSQALRKGLITDIEQVIFGNDDSNGESSKNDKSLPYNTDEADEYLQYAEEENKDQKKISDEYDSNGWSSGSGLKILTKKQMLNRLPILLAQIQAGNNSIRLKNEIRQILYSLYRSKALTKTVYNNLIKVIVRA